MSRVVILSCCLLIIACTRIYEPIPSSSVTGLQHEARSLDTFFLDWEQRRQEATIVIAYRLNDAPLGIDDDGLDTLRELIPVMPPNSVITIVPYRASDGSYPFDSAALKSLAMDHGIQLLEPVPFPSQTPQDASVDDHPQAAD